VLFEIIDDHVALVTLNRPHKRNAVNGTLASALGYLVKQVEADDSIGVAILASSGESVFCAGADLGEVAAGRFEAISTPDGGFAGFHAACRQKPWIAAVRGKALGGGLELCLACDMIVAATDATFGLPEVKRGLLAAAGGIYRLPRAISRNIALELIATGNAFSAERAYALGIVNRVVPSDAVQHEARQLAREIAANAPLAVRESLKIARLAPERPESELRELARSASRIIFNSEDAKEGSTAFLQNRTPRWSGR
jgi:enoyl-CoA hydratase